MEKEFTKIIQIEEDILVVGLSLQKSGLPITFDSLGKLWDTYSKNIRGNEINAISPLIEYGICENKQPDYIVGYQVLSFNDDKIDEKQKRIVIPKGPYIMDFFSAESFELLVNSVMQKSNVKLWAKENKVKIDRSYVYEVYQREELNKDNFSMYTLTPIINKV